MSFRRLLPGCLLCHFSLSMIAAPPPELVVLQTQYEHAVAQRVMAVHEAATTALDAKFTTALDAAITQAKGAGDLTTVLAIQGDKKLLADTQPLPGDDDKTPEALKKLRAIYRDQRAKLTEQRDANATALLSPYAARLKELEATLTKADRIAEAQEVLAYREGLETGTPPPSPVAVPTSATSAKPMHVPEQRATTAMKPSEAAAASRQLAEWCLNNKHEINILTGRQGSTLQNLQDLPKDSFEILKIEFRSNLPVVTSGPFPWRALAAVPNLKVLYLDLDKKDVTMADLAHLAVLKQLDRLEIGGEIHWVEFDPQQLPTLPELRILTFRKATQTAEIPLLREKFPNLESITFASLGSTSNVTPEKLEQLSAWRGLFQLRLDGVAATLTPEHVTALSKLPGLNSLILYPFNAVIDPSIKTLTRIEGVALNYGFPVETLSAIAAMPGLTSFSVSNNKMVADADLAALAGLTKLTELKLFTMTGLTDASVAHITALKTLTSLDVSGSPYTDAVLPELAKMKKLKKLGVRKTSITDAGAAAFKRQRPDIELTR